MFDDLDGIEIVGMIALVIVVIVAVTLLYGWAVMTLFAVLHSQWAAVTAIGYWFSLKLGVMAGVVAGPLFETYHNSKS